MGLDNRSRELLMYLLQHPTHKSSEIMEHFALSKRQFNYSFEKINEYLQDNGIEKISRTKRGISVIPSSVFTRFHEGVSTSEKEYIYSEKERQCLIILSILAREEELSLLHMSDITHVSKNTVLNDMKEVHMKAAQYQLSVVYDRKNGYHLEGDEIDKRYLMIEIVREINKVPNVEQLFLQICSFSHKDIFDIMNRIILIEKSLDIRISDERLNELRYIVLLTIRRIEQGKTIHKLPTDFYSVNGTFEFEKTKFILRDVKNANEEEHIFMTLQILISNISNMNEPILVCHENIYGLVEMIIDNFEQLGCVKFRDKKGLCNFLFQHFKPAYFRIKYDFHIENDITDIVLNEYYYLQEIIEQAIAPVEKKMGKKFPKSEIFYILIIIGGWLRKENHIIEPDRIVKAVVVCSNGISVSNYLYMTLKGMFKNIIFLDCISQRDFKKYDKEYDIVFSSSYLETDKKLYVVNPMMNELEKSQFFIKVTGDMLGITSQSFALDDIMEIVSHHVSSYDVNVMRRELQEYFLHGTTTREHVENSREDVQKEPSFYQVLPKDHVFMKKRLDTWTQALDILRAPLLEKGYIEPCYTEEIQRQIRTFHPYIMIANGFVILHAGVNDGVHEVTMSLLKLDQKVSIEGYMEADILLMLATPDTKIHLRALNQMLDRLVKEKRLHRLRKAKSVDEMYQILFHEVMEKKGDINGKDHIDRR